MRLKTTIALLSGVLALSAFPALGVANHGESHGKSQGAPYGKAKGPTYTPAEPPSGHKGPKNSLPPHAKAYGRYCQGESKKHVKGEKGTAFSRCVKAMAKAARDERLSARKACKGLSKKHVKGEQGTPFSRCVKAAAQLRKDQEESQA